MDVKGILLLLADTNRNGKVDLGDLPGVLDRVAAAKAQIKAVEAAFHGLAEAKNLTKDGKDVSPEELAGYLAEADAELAKWGDKASALDAKIAAAGGGGA